AAASPLMTAVFAGWPAGVPADRMSGKGAAEMAEVYTGEVRDGVVVFEGSPPPLPPGTKVRIEPIGSEESSTLPPTLAERLKSVIGVVRGLPPDLAEQHDHYLHGRPKR